MKSIFKLTRLHLFLIVIFVLLASSLGFSMFEYFQSEIQQENKALKKGDQYDPFKNATNNPNNNDGYYDAIIGDLEDIVIPERRKRKHHHHNSMGEHSNNDTQDDNYNPDPDKYILKSEIVPPVCPKCPDSRTCPRQKPCAPCPPCGRCPESSFTCKKVPTLSASSVKDNNVLSGEQRNNSVKKSGTSNSTVGGSLSRKLYNNSSDRSFNKPPQNSNNIPMPQLNSFAAFN